MHKKNPVNTNSKILGEGELYKLLMETKQNPGLLTLQSHIRQIRPELGTGRNWDHNTGKLHGTNRPFFL